jgi:hypothetical protein
MEKPSVATEKVKNRLMQIESCVMRNPCQRLYGSFSSSARDMDASGFGEDSAEDRDAPCGRLWDVQNVRADHRVFALRGDLRCHRSRGRWLS